MIPSKMSALMNFCLLGTLLSSYSDRIMWIIIR